MANGLFPLIRVTWMRRSWMWAALAAAVLILFLPPLAELLPAPAPVERTIRIEASLFDFIPGQIRVNPGDRVTIELVSTDVVHGFSLDGYNVEVEADPGQTARVSFVAGRPGVFRFRCSVACGNLHPFMIGRLQVGPNLVMVRGLALAGLALLVAVGVTTSRGKPTL